MNNRRKGHNLERQVASDLKQFFPFAKTSRASSKHLDDSGVDINFVPILIQCKSGYKKNRPKFEEEKQKVAERINVNFPPTHPIHDMPFILIHKVDRQPPKVEMDYDLFLLLLEDSRIKDWVCIG